MNTLAISLESTGENVRAIILEQDAAGKRWVVEIYESSPSLVDDLWSHISYKHPTLTHVAMDGVWEEADCLTVREAAEAYFGHALPA